MVRLAKTVTGRPYVTGAATRAVGAQEGTTADEKCESRVEAWTDLGVSRRVAEQLATSCPHIIRPTPAQRLFLLAVMADKEVFLKDDMGRGKTLALAIAALNLATRTDNARGVRIIILVPTPYLAHQIYEHLQRLNPVGSPTSPSSSSSHRNPSGAMFTLLRPGAASVSTMKSASLPMPDTPIVLATAKDLTQYDLSDLPDLTHIFVDEPDTLVGAIPPRHTTAQMLLDHPLFKHPPPIVDILNTLLRIRSTRKGLDFGSRRDDINTIWTSATMGKEFKRVVKTRGWIRRGKGAVDLDFTATASDKARDLRDRLLAALPARTDPHESSGSATGPDRGVPAGIQHYALVIDPADGTISPLEPGAMITPPTALPKLGRRMSKPGTSVAVAAPGADPDGTPSSSPGSLPPSMLESLALLHTTSNLPQDSYTLALPPEGISLPQLAEDLSELGIPTLILAPQFLQLGLAATLKHLMTASAGPEVGPSAGATADLESGEAMQASAHLLSPPPILLAQRSSVPGLHLQDLHTVYLLGGLDVAGLSKKQRRSGGVRDRYGVYDLVAGRLGRLGTGSALTSPTPDQPAPVGQRVVSLVMGGSEEEKRLGEMFLARARDGEQLALSQWDLHAVYAAMEQELARG
ncbi:hypothetical protein IAU60_001552 [Kwoniella sp. DSM 27419]